MNMRRNYRMSWSAVSCCINSSDIKTRECVVSFISITSVFSPQPTEQFCVYNIQYLWRVLYVYYIGPVLIKPRHNTCYRHTPKSRCYSIENGKKAEHKENERILDLLHLRTCQNLPFSDWKWSDFRKSKSDFREITTLLILPMVNTPCEMHLTRV